jgi:hypothetical protein
MFDIHTLISTMTGAADETRKGYHASVGDLIDHLRSLPVDQPILELRAGLSSYRGYYTDVAIVNRPGTVYDRDGDIEGIDVDWGTTAGVRADAIESIIGKYFTGYKGGDYKIARDKPLWYAEDNGDCSQVAVVGFIDGVPITRVIE